MGPDLGNIGPDLEIAGRERRIRSDLGRVGPDQFWVEKDQISSG